MNQNELFEECGKKIPKELVLPAMDDRVLHEIHRMMGFLRFSPGPDGVYTARCNPDNFILPALARHFYLRFGEATAWVIIDEKRNLCLYRGIGCLPRLIYASEADGAAGDSKITGDSKTFNDFKIPDDSKTSGDPEISGDFYEELWRLYHRSVNNEARKNPRLQRQFMPERYRKYLTELS